MVIIFWTSWCDIVQASPSFNIHGLETIVWPFCKCAWGHYVVER